MKFFELTKIMMEGSTGREWSDTEILDLIKEARDKFIKGSKQYKKMDDFINSILCENCSTRCLFLDENQCEQCLGTPVNRCCENCFDHYVGAIA